MSQIADIVTALLSRLERPVQTVITAGRVKAHVFRRQDFVAVEDSPPRVVRPAHVFTSAMDLASWLKARQNTVTSVNSGLTDVAVIHPPNGGGLLVTAELNPWQPGSGTVTARIAKTPEWAAWSAAIAAPSISLDDFTCLLREHPGFLGANTIEVNGRATMTPYAGDLLKKLVCVDISSTAKLSVRMDGSGRATLTQNSAENSLGPVTFDPTLPVETSGLFVDVPRAVTSQIHITPKVVRNRDDTVELRFVLSWPDQAIHIAEAVEAQVELLRANLDGWQVVAASLSTAEFVVPYSTER